MLNFSRITSDNQTINNWRMTTGRQALVIICQKFYPLIILAVG